MTAWQFNKGFLVNIIDLNINRRDYVICIID
jgi:hypothetical protein